MVQVNFSECLVGVGGPNVAGVNTTAGLSFASVLPFGASMMCTLMPPARLISFCTGEPNRSWCQRGRAGLPMMMCVALLARA